MSLVYVIRDKIGQAQTIGTKTMRRWTFIEFTPAELTPEVREQIKGLKDSGEVTVHQVLSGKPVDPSNEAYVAQEHGI